MGTCFFVSDLHGNNGKYQKLFDVIEREKPDALFLGGDLFPSGLGAIMDVEGHNDFLEDVFAPGFRRLRENLGPEYPAIFIILGNDDARVEEPGLQAHENLNLWNYAHNNCRQWGDFRIFGYSFIPPTPFMLKDWERYDISRYLDPLCVAPEEGWISVPVSKRALKYQTIQDDLEQLAGKENLSRAIFLFHTPPYKTSLDRAALDGKKVDYVEFDVHVGSIAVRRFIESRQPLLTLHGHIHESARLTGSWKERIGRTFAFSAAHDGPELALVRFSVDELENATRELL
ncbi:MAG TPA: metallophosphoesterase [Acidobacteriota bacterium]|nr:metallophosphoesterase [Acidobacteriota bacterium]